MLDAFEQEQECQTPVEKEDLEPQDKNEEYLDLKLK